MDLVGQIREDSRRRLRSAAEARFLEAESLAESGYGLASVYLHGYSVEIVLGLAFFSREGYGEDREIGEIERRAALYRARQESADPREAHPIDGWAALLVKHSRSRYHGPFAAALTEKTSVIWRHWRPVLRYKTPTVSGTQLAEVRTASGWVRSNLVQIERG